MSFNFRFITQAAVGSSLPFTYIQPHCLLLKGK